MELDKKLAVALTAVAALSVMPACQNSDDPNLNQDPRGGNEEAPGEEEPDPALSGLEEDE